MHVYIWKWKKVFKMLSKKRIDLTSRHTCWGRGVRISESSQVSSGAPPKACSRSSCSSSRTLCSARAARMFSSFIFSSTSARSFSQSSYKKSENWISWVQGRKPTKIQIFDDKILGNWKPEMLNNRSCKCTNSILTNQEIVRISPSLMFRNLQLGSLSAVPHGLWLTDSLSLSLPLS